MGLFVFILGAGMEVAADNELAIAAQRKDATPSVTTRSIDRQQSGIMNRQVLEAGTSPDGTPAAGAKASLSNIRQNQTGVRNDQEMSVGRLRQ